MEINPIFLGLGYLTITYIIYLGKFAPLDDEARYSPVTDYTAGIVVISILLGASLSPLFSDGEIITLIILICLVIGVMLLYRQPEFRHPPERSRRSSYRVRSGVDLVLFVSCYLSAILLSYILHPSLWLEDKRNKVVAKNKEDDKFKSSWQRPL